MNTRFAPTSRAERVIAFCRFVLAISSLAAVYLDPLEPQRYVALSYSVLAVYAVYALIVAIWSMTTNRDSSAWQFISHIVDMAIFGVINALTAGSSSPFFIYFVFSIICGTLRFGRRGTLLTAIGAVCIYIASSLFPEVAFELNRFVIRGTYLLVAAMLLFSFAEYQHRIQRDLSTIAAWPRSNWTKRHDLVAALLKEAAALFDAPKVVLAIEHLGEHLAWVSVRVGDEMACTEKNSLVADSILNFPESIFVTTLARDFEARSVLPARFEGDFASGWLVFLDGRTALGEDRSLARITAGVVGSRLDHFFAADQLQLAAVAEDRVRVARDLHDSVLQSLTGVSLQLRTLPRVMTRDPEEAQKRLREIEDTITHGQRELRWFIDELNPERRKTKMMKEVESLTDRLATLATRFQHQWAVKVDYDIDHVVHLLAGALRQELYAIISEGIANAAKHGEARRVSVSVVVEAEYVRIGISDNGKGFPFSGQYDLLQLVSERRGPVTLKERVLSLGGKMSIASSELGASIEIALPFRSESSVGA